jgi:cytochrome c peroxidase
MRKQAIITGLLFTVSLSWMGISSPRATPTPMSLPLPPGWPAPRYDLRSNPLTVEGFLLGRKLFFDERLSRDSTLSCAGCHQPFAAFATFDHPLSHGIANSLTTRNAPALQNLAWQESYMWDGGITHLDLQPLAPLTAPNEMGESIADVLQKLRRDTAYLRLFQSAFGDTMINTRRLTRALSQYLIRLVSADSKYDRVMRGRDTFLLPEKLGYALFRQKCSNCHREPLFTDGSYRNTGLPPDNTLNDYGRMRITGKPEDSLHFRVPSLRNAAITHPYGHDGRFFSLLNVFDHYRKNGIPLSNFEIGQLTAFINTLTDTAFLHDPLFVPPGYPSFFIHRH